MLPSNLLRLLLLALAIPAMALGCGEDRAQREGKITATYYELAAPIQAWAREVSWIDGRLWYVIYDDANAKRASIWSGSPGEAAITRVPTIIEDNAERTCARSRPDPGGDYREDGLVALPEGRILFVVWCGTETSVGNPPRSGTIRWLMTYDPARPTEPARRLLEHRSIDHYTDLVADGIGVDQSGNRLLLPVTERVRTFSGIHSVDEPAHLIEVDLATGASRDLPYPPGFKQVWSYAIAPDGKRAAFWAKAGTAPERTDYLGGDVWIANVDFSEARKLTDMRGGEFIAWSSDGRWLVVRGGKEPGQDGVWLVDAKSGKTRLIEEGEFGVTQNAWEPGGTRFAVTRLHRDPDLRGWQSDIAIYDIADLR